MKQLEIKCPPSFHIGSKVYIIPCFLGNKEIVQYEILDFHLCSLGCGCSLVISKKQKGLEPFIRLEFSRFYEIAFPTREQAESKLKELKNE